MLRGSETTVYFGDGRTAPAKFLGRDIVLDIGLAKITAPGPWPYVPLGRTAALKAGDTCIIAGYPNYLRKEKEVPLVVRSVRIADTPAPYAPTELFTVAQTWDGDSGGGVFNNQGRLTGVLHGTADTVGSLTHTEPRRVVYAAADEFVTLWDSLVKGPAFGDPIAFDESPAAAAVRGAIADLPPIVCEVLGDGKRRALGTIVSPDGYVLTKASELYGNISCRLADGRMLPAAVRNVAREHDLALLKIEARGLPQIVWRRHQEPPVGTLVASLRIGEPPTVGVVSYPQHKVASAAGYLAVGKVKDADGGIEVEELHSWWPDWDEEPVIRVGDVIVNIEGRSVANVASFEKMTIARAGTDARIVPFVIAGDPIHVTVRRGGKELKLCFPSPSTRWDCRDKMSPRNCSFPAVFDTDASVARDTCGGPLLDRQGQVVGITIAAPVPVIKSSPVMSRVFVVPAAVARSVAEKLK